MNCKWSEHPLQISSVILALNGVKTCPHLSCHKIKKAITKIAFLFNSNHLHL
jgi:hypothetical protein